MNNNRLPLAVITCGSCNYWHDGGPQLLSSGQPNVNLPNQGECRERLNAERLLRMTQQGPEILGWITGYPVVPASFPACGQYQSRQTVLA